MAEYINKENLKFLEIPIAPVLQGEQVHYEQGFLKEWLENVPTADVIPIPERATNGDMIKAMFPNLQGREKAFEIEVNVNKNKVGNISADWWNAPYKKDCIPSEYDCLEDMELENPQMHR